MKVSELKYERVSLEEISAVAADIIQKVTQAQSAEEVLSARSRYVKLMSHYQTAAALSYMRYSINTADEFYLAEKDYYDEIGPQVQSLMLSYAKAMLNTPFRKELEASGDIIPLVFQSYELELRAMSPDIVEDMIEENRVVSEYSRLMASMEFPFRGELLPRAQLMKYAKSDKRETRREAYEVLGTTLQQHATQLDELFDRLVHIRDRMAKKMGYRNFVEMGDYRMGRLGYGRNELLQFRDNVERDLVPVVSRLRMENAKRLGLSELRIYDHDIVIPGGDPEPIGGKDAIFQAAQSMYRDMGKETRRFFDFMMETDAFDVESRKNKWGGGYCTEFAEYKQPFILANFNGTSGDVDVVTHEAGHAFASYMTANNRFVTELSVGGMETAETHSMSMEFFAWPYMEAFFGDQAAKYKFMHLFDALSFIPYGTIVDEFQRRIYEEPDLSPAERKAVWRELEARFRPYLTLEGLTYLEEGTRWQYQMHIYETPFYYIDYCLAQTAALQFLLASREDYSDAYSRYLTLLSQGGEKTFAALLKEAGLRSPFEPGALRELAQETEDLLNALAQEAL